MTPARDGLLLLDKPAGPTSHDLVAGVRRALRVRRVGHTGTLDPAATGLLVLLLGRATRLARFVPDAPKLYEGTFRLGVRTSTDDLEGEVLARHDGELPGPGATAEAAGRLVGRSLQVPPSVSARKVGGKRLYTLARRGAAIEGPPAPVVITRFTASPLNEPGAYAFLAEVSTGTYVRSLVRDLGADLGCGAAVATLRRTAIGPLTVEQALPLEASGTIARGWDGRGLIPLDRIPFAIPEVTAADESACRIFASGRPIPVVHVPGEARDGPVVVRAPSGEVIGVGDRTGDLVKPRVVLPRANDAGAPVLPRRDAV